MGWNSTDFVLTADAQFNGCKAGHVRNLDEYVSYFDGFDSKYQVVVSPELSRIMPTLRQHEPIDSKWDIAAIRHHDEEIVGYPMEFYQSQLQKPDYYVDFRGRDLEFAEIIRSNPVQINWILDYALSEFQNQNKDLDFAIDEGVIEIFGDLDHEMLGIIAGYIKQKPRRMIFLVDMEAVHPDSTKILTDPIPFFQWLEVPYRHIREALLNFGIETLTVCSGKGYHFIAAIPLFNSHGYYSDAMLSLMAIGGAVQAETIDRLVTTHPEKGKDIPAPILTQRAYQGMNKVMQYVVVNILDDIRKDLHRAGLPPYVGVTDNHEHQISIDLTGSTRQVEMGCFGSVGSIYNKKWDRIIVRIPRARGREEFFDNDLSWMLDTRGSLEAAKAHLIHSGGWIPETDAGMVRLIQAYEASSIKRNLHEPCEGLLDPAAISSLINTNYAVLREKIPQIGGVIDNAQPEFLTPSALDYVYHEMLYNGFSVNDMRHLTYAIYCDTVKNVHIEPAYSKAEWCRWPILLMGEFFKD
ncbi:MAG: hypothetical protein CVV64_14355 [Candidatus Wallbacteria bacterium HGW-Wallbacteria-1]|jgi:hypothetical protein|uniref:Uncharacterized protein n=1 Tax=Candidatus Wallbacteria bacterium HGW-Wallbacteria-1 TaxID=2013854 RepID=A0A2N1PM89_9BACT|nr:MAG: hypothetical protein CVV64_14355 [Candidatus Wallbacteria bacterium HGW-Wallbacteria-1]